MNRTHRNTPPLLVLTLAALAACGTEGRLSAPTPSINPTTGLPHVIYNEQKDSLAADAWLGAASLDAAVRSGPRATAAILAGEDLGTNLDLGDDECQGVQIGFPFTFYGAVHTFVGVSSNGHATFSACNGRSGTDGLLPKGTLTLLAPAIGDWDPEPGANNVFYKVVGAEPHRRFIVTWNNIPAWGALSQPRSTFRVILHETSNLVELDWPSVPFIKNIKYRAGISSATTRYVLLATGAEILALNGKSVCFTPDGASDYTVSHEPCPLPVKPNSPPVADAGGPYAAEEGSAILFNGVQSSDPDGDALSFAWTFGDGGTGTGVEASHVYIDQGSYPVSLLVSDPDGLSSEAAATANVFNVAPSVTLGSVAAAGLRAMVAPAPVFSGETYALTATFSDPGVGDAPWRWTVDWGNGDTDSGEALDQAVPIVVERRLLSAGSYDVTLVVKDKDGDATTAKTTVVVNRFPLEIDIKPGDAENALNLGSRGRFWAAILTTPNVDAANVLPSSVRLGGASVVLHGRGILRTKLEDVDDDGDLDLMLQFETQDLVQTRSIGPFTQQLELLADFVDGRQGAGSDAVRVVR